MEENCPGHHFARRIDGIEANDTIAIRLLEDSVQRIIRIDAQRMIKLIDKFSHHRFDHLEIHYHVAGIQSISDKNHLHGTRMTMGEFAIARMLGQHMSAFHFNPLADTIHDIGIVLLCLPPVNLSSPHPGQFDWRHP